MWGEKCSRDLGKDKARAVTMALVVMALVTMAPGMKALVAMALVVMALVLTHPPSRGKGESKAWRSSSWDLPRLCWELVCSTLQTGQQHLESAEMDVVPRAASANAALCPCNPSSMPLQAAAHLGHPPWASG